MRTRHVVVLLIVALAVGAALYWRAPSMPAGSDGADTHVPHAPVEAVQARRGEKFATAPSIPLPEGLFAAVRPELERRARDGDAKAALRLARVLLNCHSFHPYTDAEIEDRVIDGLAHAGDAPIVDGKPIPPDVLVDWMRGRMRAQRDLCAGTDPKDFTSNEVDAKAAVELLLRAAKSGDTEAMIEYARSALTQYLLPAQVIAHAETVKAISRDAVQYLDAALAAGDAEALQAWSDEYQYGRLVQRDAVQAYAYLYAYAQSSKADDGDAWWRRLRLEQMRQAMTQTQIDDAQRKAAALLAQCCNGPVRAP